MKCVYLLGAAGSIGQQTLEVIEKHPKQFLLVGCSLSHNQAMNVSILDRHPVEICCLRTPDERHFYQERYPNTHFVFGEKGLLELAEYPKPGILVNALSGSAGLHPTVRAIQAKKDIALANKETLVMAGDLIIPLVEQHKVNLLPIDSEHHAIWRLLEDTAIHEVHSITLTASGGAFRHVNRDDLSKVTIEEALQHPNWKMGAKITIDSATMMNKGLEVIEAHHLFKLPFDRIQTVLHEESLVHGIVTFKSGKTQLFMGPSDMKIPIYDALSYPNKPVYSHSIIAHCLSFKPMDVKRYPLLKLAYEVGEKGGLLPTVMNAANEAAVKLFLAKRIPFLAIESIVFQTVSSFRNVEKINLDLIIKTDYDIQKSLWDAYPEVR